MPVKKTIKKAVKKVTKKSKSFNMKEFQQKGFTPKEGFKNPLTK